MVVLNYEKWNVYFVQLFACNCYWWMWECKGPTFAAHIPLRDREPTHPNSSSLGISKNPLRTLDQEGHLLNKKAICALLPHKAHFLKVPFLQERVIWDNIYRSRPSSLYTAKKELSGNEPCWACVRHKCPSLGVSGDWDTFKSSYARSK